MDAYLELCQRGNVEYGKQIRLERFWDHVEVELNARDRQAVWQRAPLPLFSEYPADVVHAMPERIRVRLGIPSASAYIP